jgi:predicted NUDIX family phosphoesterase
MSPKSFWQLGKLYNGDEPLMGLPNEIIFAHGQWQGFLMDENKCREIVRLAQIQPYWKPRDQAEKDPDWQQIYPYALFKYQDRYAEFKRGTTASDTSMNLRYTLAVGGHIFQSEFEQFKTLENFIIQIFLQDIEYEGNLKASCIGVVNDKADELNDYHVGIVYVLEGDSPDIRSKIHTETRLVKLADMNGEDVQFLERWSQMIYRQLRDKEIADKEGLSQHFHVSHLMEGK